MTPRTCPNCGSHIFVPLHRRFEIRREIDTRSRFVRHRLDHKPEASELMDLTAFMHGGPDPLLACGACGLVLRDEPYQASYATDVYDPDLLQQLYPRYRDAFREKRDTYRCFIPVHAELIEVGSHLGAFLEAAEESDWRPTGLDVGEITSAFSARRGLRVKRESIEDARLPAHSADAVFVWNCFEQLEEPAGTLRAAYRLLRHHGTLVIRIPNFAFYENRRVLAGKFQSRGEPQSGAAALRELAYNNLLGFPYLTGYTPATLNSLVERHGFQPIAGFDTTLITMPFPELSEQVQRELDSAYESYRHPHAKQPAELGGPWIEIVYRRKDG